MMYVPRASILHRPKKAPSQHNRENLDAVAEAEQAKWEAKRAVKANVEERMRKSMYPSAEDVEEAKAASKYHYEYQKTVRRAEEDRQKQLDTYHETRAPTYARAVPDRPWTASTADITSEDEAAARRRQAAITMQENRRLMAYREQSSRAEQEAAKAADRELVTKEDTWFNYGATSEKWIAPQFRRHLQPPAAASGMRPVTNAHSHAGSNKYSMDARGSAGAPFANGGEWEKQYSAPPARPQTAPAARPPTATPYATTYDMAPSGSRAAPPPAREHPYAAPFATDREPPPTRAPPPPRSGGPAPFATDGTFAADRDDNVRSSYSRSHAAATTPPPPAAASHAHAHAHAHDAYGGARAKAHSPTYTHTRGYGGEAPPSYSPPAARAHARADGAHAHAHARGQAHSPTFTHTRGYGGETPPSYAPRAQPRDAQPPAHGQEHRILAPRDPPPREVRGGYATYDDRSGYQQYNY